MWILTKIGFYSITKKPSHLNPDGPSVFNVRGRDKDDLKRFAELVSPVRFRVQPLLFKSVTCKASLRPERRVIVFSGYWGFIDTG